MPQATMTSEERTHQENEVVRKYLEVRKILIVDPSPTSRSGIFKILQDLGAKTLQLFLAKTFQDAQNLIEREKPHVVITEYELAKRCGLELIQNQKAQHPETSKQSLFVILTGNTSQTAVARSAEEDVDAFIIKPYTPAVVRKTLITAAINKIKPSDYTLTIEEGKTLLSAGKIDDAEACFEKAKTMNESPALAFYYLGQIKTLRKVLDDAKGSYRKGLELNRIHYKCLVGLYDLLMEQKKFDEAYEVVRKLSQYFPANPKRLSEVLRLAILNSKYDDIERYYNIFINIDERDELLIRYVCAALIVCGKYYLGSQNARARAVDLFKRAVVTGAGRGYVLREIIPALLDSNLVQEARNFFLRFPSDAFGSNDYLLMEFLISYAENPSRKVFESGRELMSKGIVEERLFTSLLNYALSNRMASIVEDVLLSAIKHYPGKKDFYENLVKGFQSNEAKDKSAEALVDNTKDSSKAGQAS